LGALLLVVATAAAFNAQTTRRARVLTPRNSPVSAADWTGVYRLDAERSDKLYSVVSGASSNLPFGEQQRFFLDLTVRLAPPDQLAVERRGRRISVASSRAPRITFDADGVTRAESGPDGQMVRTRAVLAGDRLTVTSEGGSADRFTVVFEPATGGRELRVTRHILAPQLTQPVVVRSVYNKISDVARWEIYGTPTDARPAADVTATTSADRRAEPERRSEPDARATANRRATPTLRATGARVAARGRDAAAELRAALDDWLAATNARDISRQMIFYLPTLDAYYLQRQVPRAAVRAEKARVFARARTVDIRAAEPEILLSDDGRAAVMRFRKAYVIAGGGQDRRGEVVQELRWQRTAAGWRISSERDVRVLR
jgi:ketosteroid isomerase-like protein